MIRIPKKIKLIRENKENKANKVNKYIYLKLLNNSFRYKYIYKISI